MLRTTRLKMLLGAAFAMALVVALVPGGESAAGASTPKPYYLALGDSLSQGVQPNSSGQSVETNAGYANDLYDLYKYEVPGLQLEKLGCPGETTGTMISGGICPYALGSQLAQAVSFLGTHHVALVTIDIGANNVDGCLTASGIDETCITDGIAAAATDLPEILTELRAAAPGVPIVAMNYYDPFLSEWLLGSAGQALATESVSLATYFNGILGSIYGAFGVPVANVQGAFLTTDFNTVPFIGLPTNVAAICSLTWMCAPPPVGPNIHANVLGYGLIAATFEQEIGFL